LFCPEAEDFAGQFLPEGQEIPPCAVCQAGNACKKCRFCESLRGEWKLMPGWHAVC
jgi:hypothetical protein